MGTKRDMFSYFKVLPANVHVSGITQVNNTGNTIDTRGYDSLTFNVNFIATSTAADPAVSYWYARIEHADASAAGNDAFSPVTGLDLIREGISAAVVSGIVPLVASTYSGSIVKIGYRGNKRYVRCNISTTGAFTATSGVLPVEAVLCAAAHWPVTTPNLDAV